MFYRIIGDSILETAHVVISMCLFLFGDSLKFETGAWQTGLCLGRKNVSQESDRDILQ